jgi:hypothetical protein
LRKASQRYDMLMPRSKSNCCTPVAPFLLYLGLVRRRVCPKNQIPKGPGFFRPIDNGTSLDILCHSVRELDAESLLNALNSSGRGRSWNVVAFMLFLPCFFRQHSPKSLVSLAPVPIQSSDSQKMSLHIGSGQELENWKNKIRNSPGRIRKYLFDNG